MTLDLGTDHVNPFNVEVGHGPGSMTSSSLPIPPTATVVSPMKHIPTSQW
jgi:hypothetical protein